MSEDFSDYGNYRKYIEDEEFKKRPLIKKIFSLRGLKIFFKILGYTLLISLFVILFARMCTSRPSEESLKMIWTEKSYGAYVESGGNLRVYTQNIGRPLDEDGKFAVYDFRYIPDTNEVQFTIRYNRSTVEKLAEELTEAKKEELGELYTDDDEITYDSLSALPFIFTVRDDFGNVYTESEYIVFTKNLYTYIRISFSGIDLFKSEKTTPKSLFPSPSVTNPSYIYKGRFSPEESISPITYLFLDSYYKDDYTLGNSFSKTLTFYRSNRGTELYDYGKEKPENITEGLRKASAMAENQLKTEN